MSKDFFKFRESILNEDIRKMSHSRLKFHATKNVPHGSYSRSEIEDEHERRKKTAGAEYAKAKATMSEQVELDEKAYVSSLSPEMGRKGSHDVIGKDGKVVKSYPYTKDGMKAAQAHLSKMKEEVELDEAKLSPQQRDRLDDLILNVHMTTHPEYDGEETPGKYLKAIEKEFGAKVAKQVEDGIEIAHWGRDNRSSGNDKLSWRKGGARITKSGKMNKQDVEALKNRIKRDKAWGGITKKVKLPEEVELDEAGPKMKDDYVKTQREKDKAHADAMGRHVKSGRKKTMTSTQRSLASMRNEEVELGEAYGPGHIGAIQKMIDKERKYKKPTQAEIDADRKKDEKGKSRSSMTAKSAGRKQYAGMMGGLKNEEAENLDEISRDTARSYIRKASADNAERKKEVMKPFPMKDMGKNVEMHKKFKKREAGIELAGKKAYGIGGKAKVSATESVEQLDELSPNLLHRYVKKAAGNLAGNAAVAAAQASSSMKKSSPDVKRKMVNRMKGIAGASGRMADKANMAEEYVNEKLKVSHGMGAWVDDFKKSDAPQFKGKSDKERRDMAVAAYLSAKRGQKEEYASDAQRKAVWASRAEKGKK